MWKLDTAIALREINDIVNKADQNNNTLLLLMKFETL